MPNPEEILKRASAEIRGVVDDFIQSVLHDVDVAKEEAAQFVADLTPHVGMVLSNAVYAPQLLPNTMELFRDAAILYAARVMGTLSETGRRELAALVYATVRGVVAVIATVVV